MTTAVVDDKHRVRIPDLKPGEVVAYRDNGDNTITLTKVTAESREPFPRGSLLKEVEDMNREWAEIAEATVVGVPKEIRRQAGDK